MSKKHLKSETVLDSASRPPSQECEPGEPEPLERESHTPDGSCWGPGAARVSGPQGRDSAWRDSPASQKEDAGAGWPRVCMTDPTNRALAGSPLREALGQTGSRAGRGGTGTAPRQVHVTVREMTPHGSRGRRQPTGTPAREASPGPQTRPCWPCRAGKGPQWAVPSSSAPSPSTAFPRLAVPCPEAEGPPTCMPSLT